MQSVSVPPLPVCSEAVPLRVPMLLTFFLPSIPHLHPHPQHIAFWKLQSLNGRSTGQQKGEHLPTEVPHSVEKPSPPHHPIFSDWHRLWVSESRVVSAEGVEYFPISFYLWRSALFQKIKPE